MKKKYLENDYIILEVPKQYRYNSQIDFTNINEKYYDVVKDFYQTLKRTIQEENLTIFYNRIPSLIINDKISLMKVCKMFKITNTTADYVSKSNQIYIYHNKKENPNDTLNHELLHMSSSFYDKCNNIDYCGFSQSYNMLEIGTALNEGYTEYKNYEIFNMNIEKIYYIYEFIITKLLEVIINKTTMEKLYFNADLYNLVKELEKYNKLNNIKKFIFKTDFILCLKENPFYKSKKCKYIMDINYFLLETYINKLYHLYINKKITKLELEELYIYFIEELKVLLDINLAINKDILRKNIYDTVEIQLCKVRKLI